MRHVRSIVEKIYNTHLPESFKALGIDLSFGDPQFTDNHTIVMDGKTITANKIIIATGSARSSPPSKESTILPISPITRCSPSTRCRVRCGAWWWPIGMELASAFNRLGVETTVWRCRQGAVQGRPGTCGHAAGKMRGEGLNIITSAKASSCRAILTITLDG